MNISEFVVGLGFDTTDFEKGSRNVTSSLSGLRSDILQVGATLAGAFGAKALTVDFARTNNELRQVADRLGITTDALYGMNEAAKAFGAREGEMSSLLLTLTSMKTRFNELGELGAFEDLAKLGVNIDRLTGAKDGVSAMLALSDELAALSTSRRAEVADVLGISPQSLDLLASGSAAVKGLSDAYQQARPHTEAMADASKSLIAQWNELVERIGGRADKISTPLVASLASITSGMNDWLEANQQLIDQSIDEVIKAISENLNILAPAAVAVAGSGLVSMFAGLAKSVPIVGGSLATMAKSLGAITVAAGAFGIVSELWNWDAKDFKEATGIELPDWIFKPINELDFEDVFPSSETGKNAVEGGKEVYGGESTLSRGSVGGVAQGVGREGVTSRNVETTVNVQLELDGEKLAERQIKLINGALDPAKLNAYMTEDR